MKSKDFLDETNRFIISEMTKNGRVTYTELAKKLNITPAAVKERVERLYKNKIIQPSVLLNTKELFPVSATIGVEADSECITMLAKKLRPCPLVIIMGSRAGVHNLIIHLVAEDFSQLESFLNNQIRNEPGVKHVEVNVGHKTDVVPDFTQMRLFYEKDTDFVPCGLRYDDKNVCLNCPGLANVKKYKEQKAKKSEKAK